jgi:hypothetical protein
MLNYVGNYTDWIDNSWINEILNGKGILKPDYSEVLTEYEKSEFDKCVAAGYKMSYTMWEVFQERHVTFNITEVPWAPNIQINWWITKMLPGQFMPLHRDPHTMYIKSKRYWVPLQDYEPGHIFMYKDSVITNYKKGDVYCYQDATDIHGAANIGHTPRIVLQVTELEQ